MINEDSAAYLFDEFIKAPNPTSCKQLLVATVSLVQSSVDDFRVTGQFDLLLNDTQASGFDVTSQSAMPDADDVQSSIAFRLFVELSPQFAPQTMLDNDANYQNVLKSASFLPDTNEEFYEQKSLSGLTVLMHYWRACHKHPALAQITDNYLVMMRRVYQFENQLRALDLSAIGRTRGIKLLWRLRDEIVFSIDRIGRKFSRDCFSDHCSESALMYEINLLMEKINLLMTSERDKVLALGDLERVIAVVNLIDHLAEDMRDQHSQFIWSMNNERKTLDTQDDQIDLNHREQTIEVDQLDTDGFTDQLQTIDLDLDQSIEQCHDQILMMIDHSFDPIQLFLFEKLRSVCDDIRDMYLFVQGEVEQVHHAASSVNTQQHVLISALVADIQKILEEHRSQGLDDLSSIVDLRTAQILLAQKMLSRINQYQDSLPLQHSASGLTPLDSLVARLEYIVFEQPIFIDAYTNLLNSVDEFEQIINELSTSKAAMVKPYAALLRDHATDYARRVIQTVNKPRNHVADADLTLMFQAKMGKVIEQADQSLRVHRHPNWFRVGVRLMMAIKHFINACLSVGENSEMHANLSKKVLTQDYAPASSLFACTAIDRLSQGMVTLGHQVRH